MRRNSTKTVQLTVDHHLCISCGLCKAICPKDCITLEENYIGILRPLIQEDMCIGCGECTSACPGLHQRFKGNFTDSLEGIKGTIRAAYIVYAKDEEIRAKGQSGGAVTAFLLHLLKIGVIDKAVVSRIPEDGSLRPTCNITGRSDTILNSQGSIYSPVPVLKHYNNFDGRTAIVALPCHLHGLANIGKNNLIRIGLVCGSTQTYKMIDYLVNKTGCKSPKDFRFRKKSTEIPWPGKFYCKDTSGKEYIIDDIERAKAKTLFPVMRCSLCWDKFNVHADIVFSDAWGVNENPKGVSIVLVRTKKGEDLLKKAIDENIFNIAEMNSHHIGDYFKGQDLESRFDSWKKALTHFCRNGEKKVDFGINIDLLSSNLTKRDRQRFEYIERFSNLTNGYSYIVFRFKSVLKNCLTKLKNTLSK